MLVLAVVLGAAQALLGLSFLVALTQGAMSQYRGFFTLTGTAVFAGALLTLAGLAFARRGYGWMARFYIYAGAVLGAPLIVSVLLAVLPLALLIAALAAVTELSERGTATVEASRGEAATPRVADVPGVAVALAGMQLLLGVIAIVNPLSAEFPLPLTIVDYGHEVTSTIARSSGGAIVATGALMALLAMRRGSRGLWIVGAALGLPLFAYLAAVPLALLAIAVSRPPAERPTPTIEA